MDTTNRGGEIYTWEGASHLAEHMNNKQGGRCNTYIAADVVGTNHGTLYMKNKHEGRCNTNMAGQSHYTIREVQYTCRRCNTEMWGKSYVAWHMANTHRGRTGCPTCV